MKEFLQSYQASLAECLATLDPAEFEKHIGLIVEAYRNNKQIFVCGNGGSAAAANHFVCDFGKNAVKDPAKRRFRILSLSDNVERITAYGNDVAFEEIFSQQLINLMNQGDLLIAISASGKSPNIVAACRYARSRGAKVISLSGFAGGEIKALSDACLIAPLTSYEQIEDVQLILLHMTTCYIKENPQLLQP